MILPDVAVLVYAFRRESPGHAEHAAWLNAVVSGEEELALVDTVTLGVVRLVTDPRIFAAPDTTPVALGFIEALRSAPRARSLAPTSTTWSTFRRLAEADRQVRARHIPDAWLAALSISHGCRLATTDRGFARYEGLRWHVPVPPGA